MISSGGGSSVFDLNRRSSSGGVNGGSSGSSNKRLTRSQSTHSKQRCSPLPSLRENVMDDDDDFCEDINVYENERVIQEARRSIREEEEEMESGRASRQTEQKIKESDVGDPVEKVYFIRVVNIVFFSIPPT